VQNHGATEKAFHMNTGSTISRSVIDLLRAAKSGQANSLGELLEQYRNYLRILASTQLDRRLRQRLNASDLVQEAMMAAYRDFPDFRGESEGEFISWLRQILSNCRNRAIETHLQARKRDVRREFAQPVAPGADGGERLNPLDMVADHGGTPSEICRLGERSDLLSQQLAKLKPEYQEVIIYRNLQGLTFDEIAEKTGKKSGCVRMLWLRAIERFKKVCEPIE
jgi:RNA polymerase sigma-70 factor, ECF subfamily